jgi:hypothetical protein
VIAVVIGACGSEAGKPLPDPRICAANWRPVYTPDQTVHKPFDLTGDVFIRAHQDRIFVNTRGDLGLAPSGIRSVPTGGGPASLVYEGQTLAFFIEDDQLLVVGTTTLQRVPLSGGAGDPILTIHALEEWVNALISPWALDREALYWARDDFAEITVWRAPRDGSGDQRVATLPSTADVLERPHVDRLHLLDDGRLLVLSGRRVWTIPKAGGELRELTLPDDLFEPLGTAPDGTMLWTRFVSSREGGYPVYALVKLHVDDPTPGPPIITFAVDELLLQNATPDGNGGFYVLAWEYGADGGIHTTAWTLDAADRLTRVACDPEIERVAMGGAGTPDTFYPLVWTSNDWQVAAVSRTP